MNSSEHHWRIGFLGVALATFACSPPATDRAPAAPPVATAWAPDGPAPRGTPPNAPADSPDAAPPGPPRSVAFAGDGTLLIETERSLIAWVPQGNTRKLSLPEGKPTLVVSSVHAGVALTLPDRALLLTTPELTVAHDGPGTVLTDVPAVHLERERVILAQSGRAVVRLDTHRAPAAASVEAVTPLLDGKRFSVTFVEAAPDGDKPSALLYDAERAVVLGPGLPFRLYPVSAPRASARGKLGFSIEGGEVLRWDLEKGTVVRRAKVRCAADRQLGNPTPSPQGDLLVVTCGDDLIVLDGKMLQRRRVVPRVVPGCDQGPSLNGHVLPDGKTLELEGCGGIAKLDLGSGKYVCGDSAGVMGAPYLDAPPPPGAPQGLPAGRARVPACNKSADEQAYRLGVSGRYTIVYGERSRILHEKAALELEADAQIPVLSPDEAWLAYARADHVVVRSLPDGQVRALLR
ncbi:MAG: hypothetical protein L6Q84_34730 [Polyangiaceae bacterium]|nr:hypothetical protein [Polyangiaceae bacterium]